MDDTNQQVPAALWTEGLESYEDKPVLLEVEWDEDPNRISFHTFIDGQGSMCSFYLNREDAIRLAASLLRTIELERR